MKQPGIFMKGAVLASAILLASGFVAYHAGAFNRLLENVPEPAEPDEQVPPPLIFTGSFDGTSPTDPSASQPAPAGEQRVTVTVIMSGAKTAFVPSYAPPTKQEKPTTPVIMSGSKSLTIGSKLFTEPVGPTPPPPPSSNKPDSKLPSPGSAP